MPALREDAQAALAGIVAAGNDTETLAEAIEKAAFLEETPGEDRQKLRGTFNRCLVQSCSLKLTLSCSPILKCALYSTNAVSALQRREQS